ncbi:MAG TPA: nitroreductase/quinone reductase family protein [Streptosporangiaceae bacterium]
MNAAVNSTLSKNHTVSITTTGRKTGQPRTIEIWFHRVDGRYYLSGLPGKRGWLANLLADPGFVIHFTESAGIGARARALPVTDPADRRRILTAIGRSSRLGDVDTLIAGSPLVEFVIDEQA